MNIEQLKSQSKTLREKINELEKQSSDPLVLRDAAKIKDIVGELKKLQEELKLTDDLIGIDSELEETKGILNSEQDAAMKNLAQEELHKLTAKRKETLSNLENLKNPKGDSANECVMEIRAGTGGEEANLFAADLFRMYAKFAESSSWKITILNEHKSETGGFKEIIIEIDGKGSYAKLQYENGVHRVQRVPVTESAGRIHTSAASVVVYPLVESTDLEIDPKELRIDVYRSTGPGGQSVNTTDSAVRVTHLPTGIVVTCQDEKSQLKNKKKAISVLKSKLLDKKRQEEEAKISAIRQGAIKGGDRSAKIRTYNFPQNRITDHRIKKSWHNLRQVLNGDIADIVSGLQGANIA